MLELGRCIRGTHPSEQIDTDLKRDQGRQITRVTARWSEGREERTLGIVEYVASEELFKVCTR